MERSVTLLIAEDELAIRKGLAALPWQEQGLTLLPVAKNGLEALALTKSYPVDILLTDIRMPGMSGIELGDTVLQSSPHTQVIFLTGYGEFEYTKRAISMHACDYILKPSTPDEILACVGRAREAVLRARSETEDQQRMEDELKRMSVLVAASHLVDGQREDAPRDEDIVLIVAYLSEHYREPLTLTALAERFHFNTVYLSRYIKSKSGYTFTEILSNIRMYHSARLLKETVLKNGEICDRVGMNDERYWGQVFKKRYGVTPNEYRKEQRNLEKNPISAILGDAFE